MIEILMMAFATIDMTALWAIVSESGIFACLFVWLLWDSKKESKNREERLYVQMDRQGEALEKVSDTIERMDIRLSNIEYKVDDNENKTRSGVNEHE